MGLKMEITKDQVRVYQDDLPGGGMRQWTMEHGALKAHAPMFVTPESAQDKANFELEKAGDKTAYLDAVDQFEREQSKKK